MIYNAKKRYHAIVIIEVLDNSKINPVFETFWVSLSEAFPNQPMLVLSDLLPLSTITRLKSRIQLVERHNLNATITFQCLK